MGCPDFEKSSLVSEGVGITLTPFSLTVPTDFDEPPGPTSGDSHPQRGLRPSRQAARHGAPEILYEPSARWQMCRAGARIIVTLARILA